LLLLSGYLVYSIHSQREGRPDAGKLYSMFDGLFLITVVLFAIAVTLDHDRSAFLLGLMLVIAALGHWVGAFDRAPRDPGWDRARRGLADLLGVPLLFFLPSPWNMPIAFLVVLILWTAANRYNARVPVSGEQRPPPVEVVPSDQGDKSTSSTAVES
jgi:hypothetical protein